MRTGFLLVSALVFVAACSRDTETTAPRSPIATVSGSAAAQSEFPPGPGMAAQPDYPPGPGVTSPSAPGAPAKPSAGFTTVSSSTNTHSFSGGIFGDTRDIIATCAAGVVVGGGYKFDAGALNATVEYTGPFGTNAWRVRVTLPGGWTASVTTTAMCIS
jgi:hypothetical protein